MVSRSVGPGPCPAARGRWPSACPAFLSATPMPRRARSMVRPQRTANRSSPAATRSAAASMGVRLLAPSVIRPAWKRVPCMSRCSRMTLWVRQYRSRLRAHSHCGSRTTGSSVVDAKDDVQICHKGRCGARAAGMKPHDSAVLSSAFERREPLCSRFGHGGLLAGPVGARQGPGSTDAGGRGRGRRGSGRCHPTARRERPRGSEAPPRARGCGCKPYECRRKPCLPPPALAAAAARFQARKAARFSPPRARGCGAAHSVASSRSLSCVPRSRLRRPASSRQRRRRPSALGSAGGLSGLGGAGGALRRDGPVDEEADRGRAGAVADSAAVPVALDGEQVAVVQLAGEALGP